MSYMMLCWVQAPLWAEIPTRAAQVPRSLHPALLPPPCLPLIPPATWSGRRGGALGILVHMSSWMAAAISAPSVSAMF